MTQPSPQVQASLSVLSSLLNRAQDMMRKRHEDDTQLVETLKLAHAVLGSLYTSKQVEMTERASLSIPVEPPTRHA